METTMTKAMAMSAGRDICTRPWRGANTSLAGGLPLRSGDALCPSPVLTTVATCSSRTCDPPESTPSPRSRESCIHASRHHLSDSSTGHLEAADPDTGIRGLSRTHRQTTRPRDQTTRGHRDDDHHPAVAHRPPTEYPAPHPAHRDDQRPTGRAEQGGDNPMQLTELLDLHEASVTTGEGIPCRENDAELWFADTPDGVEFAKALCGTCPARPSLPLGCPPPARAVGRLGRRALRPGRDRRPQAPPWPAPQDRGRRVGATPPPTTDEPDLPRRPRCTRSGCSEIRRTMHQRRVHETQRQVQVAAEREQMRASIHAIVR